MLPFFLFILTLIVLLAFLERYMGREKLLIYYALCIVLVLTAALRPIGFDPDSEAYEQTFRHLANASDDMLIEYSFVLICNALRPFADDVHLVFLFYALISVPLKFYAIQRLSPWLFLPLVIYFGNYFLLHDYIQMRASVASGFFLLSIKPLSEGRRWNAALYFLIAMLFHYSFAALFVLLFLNNKPLTFFIS